MRYKVQFNSRDMKFLVVDTYQVDRLVADFPTLEQAKARAVWEENRWFKCTPDDEAANWPRDLAAI